MSDFPTHLYRQAVRALRSATSAAPPVPAPDRRATANKRPA